MAEQNKKAEPEGCGKLVGSTREETNENLEDHPGVEPGMLDLQSSALPLC